MCWDTEMYDKITRTPAKVQTSTLNEELGQVKVNIFYKIYILNYIYSLFFLIKLEL
jgi:hypothetical protein